MLRLKLSYHFLSSQVKKAPTLRSRAQLKIRHDTPQYHRRPLTCNLNLGSYVYQPFQCTISKMRKNQIRKKNDESAENSCLLKCLALSCAMPHSSFNEIFFRQIRRWLRVLVHLLKIVFSITPLVISAPLVIAMRSSLPVLERVWWDFAAWIARFSSPALMKFLQWASTRRDIFPRAFCDRFENFHENAPTHSWHRTVETLESAFGKQWRELFDIEEEPIGSGCIAQVYRGKLLSTGRQVAIKVIHPDVKHLVALDLDLMRLFVGFLDVFPQFRWLGGWQCVKEFAAIMNAQLNLKCEAENLLHFTKHFKNRKGLRFPLPYMEYTSESVLVETFENGMHFQNAIDQLSDFHRKEIAHVILDSYLRMVFLDNFAHGDLHPGNLLLDHSMTKSSSKNDIVMVDAGIVTKLETEDLKNFIELFHAVATGNGYKAGELIIARNLANDCRQVQSPCRSSLHRAMHKEAFCRGMENLVAEALAWNLSLKNVHVGSLLRKVMELCCTHEVKLEGKYAALVVSIAILEAVGRKLDPNADILSVALPIIIQSQMTNIQSI